MGMPAVALERIAAYREKWASIALSTERVDRPAAERALVGLYEELGLAAPASFLHYESPHAAFRDIDRWWDRRLVGDCSVCLWPEQLPLCDPSSYWRSSSHERRTIDFAVRRRSNAHGCWAYGESLPGEGRILSEEDHGAIWRAFDDMLPFDWVTPVIADLVAQFEEAFLRMEALGDPTCQATHEDFLFLGPFPWLVQEVACVDFCHQELACRRNGDFYDSLESLLRSGSLTVTFPRLCMICERPSSFTKGHTPYR